MDNLPKTSKTLDLYKVKSRILVKNLSSFLRDLVAHRSAFLGAIVIMICVLAAILAPQIAPHDPTKQRLLLSLLPPFWAKDEGVITFLNGIHGQPAHSRPGKDTLYDHIPS